MTGRPNILFLMADQLAPQALPVYGHPTVRAPRLAALAADGVVFDNAYCNHPLCAPSRFSMLSGRLASRIGAFDNACELPASVPTFVHLLRLAGYRTCLSGKMHFVGPDQLHGFEERVTTDVYPSDFCWTPDWGLGEDAWLPWYHSMRAILDAGVFRRSVNVAYDDEVTVEASRWLHEHADGGAERPFFLAVSLISPHDPYLAPRRWWDLYRDEEIDMPRVPDIPLDERDPHSRRLFHATGRHLEPVGDDDVRRARHAYYAMTSYVDDRFGALLDTLAETGLADDTVIVVTADHGDMLGERGLFFKMCFFEWSARVPLVVHAPSRYRARRVGECVSLVDLFPTLLDIAGCEAPGAVRLDGRSLAPLLDGEPDGAGREVLGEYTAEGTQAPLFMVRARRHKYVWSERDPPQLFDLEADPDEIVNRAGEARLRDVEARLLGRVQAAWDGARVRDDVIASQRTRSLLRDALSRGQPAPWDFQPFRDASKAYFRDEDAVQDSYRT